MAPHSCCVSSPKIATCRTGTTRMCRGTIGVFDRNAHARLLLATSRSRTSESLQNGHPSMSAIIQPQLLRAHTMAPDARCGEGVLRAVQLYSEWDAEAPQQCRWGQRMALYRTNSPSL